MAHFVSNRCHTRCKPEDDKIDIARQADVSPIEWDSMILCGQYESDRARDR